MSDKLEQKQDPVETDLMSFPKDAPAIATIEAPQSRSVPAHDSIRISVNGQARLHKSIHIARRYKRFRPSRRRWFKYLASRRLRMITLLRPENKNSIRFNSYELIMKEHTKLVQEQDSLRKWRDEVLQQWDYFIEQQNSVTLERDCLRDERDHLIQQRDGLLEQQKGHLGALWESESRCKDLRETNESYAIALARLRPNILVVLDDVERILSFMEFMETLSAAGKPGEVFSEI
ncbi:unnamed protein product [Penicillium manginii]